MTTVANDLSPEERWAKAQELMEVALELGPAEREEYLGQEGVDETLRQEVFSLLGYAGSTTTFVDQPAVQLMPPAEEPVPKEIGNYRLLRPLGRGGMGTVYLAVRSDGVYQKPVALKLLQAGLGSEEVVRRFRREREILAALEHPYIAHLLDGGTFSGRPYLVMEYVDGLPIDRYAAHHRLTLQERLRLFRKACEAVHFAHQNLVVHRDLKPSNLFVTADGIPKLLDFGIAKLLSTENFPHTVVATAPGRAPMTPAYASPEQVLGGTITTATDVYSLGILLYELLTGRRPYEVSGISPGKVEQIVCETPPLRPSTAVGRKLEETAALVHKESLESPSREQRRLRKALRGDLDNIVLMALAKEPQRRYASAEQLGQDLGRFLDGLPVVAHQDSFLYRFGKFVSRHKAAVAITVAVFLTLFGLVITLLVQKEEILEQRNFAQFTSNFLVNLFVNADPWAQSTPTLSAREMLDRGARDISIHRGAPPTVRAELLTTIGRSYLHLGEYEKAGELLRDGLKIRQEIYPGDHPAVAESLQMVAQLEINAGRYEEGERVARQSLQMRRRLYSAPHAEIGDSLFRLARLFDLAGRYQEARATYQEALEMVRSLEEPELLATVLDRFGLLLARLAEYDEGELLLREALKLHEDTLTPEHPKVAFTLINLARLLRDRNDLTSAEELLRRAEKIQRNAFGDRHPHLAGTLGSLGMVLSRNGRGEEGEALLLEAIAMQREIQEGPLLATLLTSLSHLHTDRRQFEKAEAAAREALAMNSAMLGKEHPETGYTLDALGIATLERGDLESAEASLTQALQIYRASFGEYHPRTAAALDNLAWVAAGREDYAEAEDWTRQALASYLPVVGEENRLVSQLYNNLGYLLRKQGKLKEALASYQKALALGRRQMAPDEQDLGLLLNNLGRLHSDLGEYEEAERLVREAIDIFESALPPDHAWQRVARRVLARALTEQQRFEEAEAILRAQMTYLKAEFGPDHRETGYVLKQLREMYTTWGQGGEDLTGLNSGK